MIKRSYRVPDWSKYNENLVKRGSITLWLDEEVIKEWYAAPISNRRGRPVKYSDKAIECMLTLRALFKLTFRMAEGFTKSVLKDLLKAEVEIPDYSLLCKRQKSLKVDLRRAYAGEGLHLVIDTTGLKVYGEGEWKVRQHGWVKHRLWRKLHLAVNGKSQAIEAYELTDLGVQDCEGLGLILEKLKAPIKKVIGDGSYDRFSCYEAGIKGGFKMLSPPQRNAKKSTERKKYNKKVDKKILEERDKVIDEVRSLGRKGWKIKEGYHQRSLAETAMHRMKGLLGNKLSTRIMEHQQLEVGIRCKILNKVTALGLSGAVAI